jgi:predicted DNA-binding ribbon-helix-helix protein
MCEYYTGADPILYESRTRSIRISGVLTSIRLENLVWDTLTEMAADEGVSTNALITQLYEEVGVPRGECSNFASFLRVTCLRYLSRRASLTKDFLTPKKQLPASGDPQQIARDSRQGDHHDLKHLA